MPVIPQLVGRSPELRSNVSNVGAVANSPSRPLGRLRVWASWSSIGAWMHLEAKCKVHRNLAHPTHGRAQHCRPIFRYFEPCGTRRRQRSR